MAGKPATRNSWTDVQMVIISVSLVLTLGLWNLFAGPDRVKASSNEEPIPTQEQAAEQFTVALTHTPLPPFKIMLNGSDTSITPTPPAQQQASAQPARRKRGGGGGGGGGTGGGGTGGGGGGTGGS